MGQDIEAFRGRGAQSYESTDETRAATAGSGRSVPSERARKELAAKIKFVKSILATAATTSTIKTGEKLHPEDRQEIVDQLMKEAESAPPRVRSAIKTALEGVIGAVESGQRGAAERLALEASASIAGEMRTVPESTTPDPDQLAAMIGRR